MPMTTRFEEADRDDLKQIYDLITLRDLKGRELEWMIDWVNGDIYGTPVERVIKFLKSRPVREQIPLVEYVQLEAVNEQLRKNR